MANYIAGIDPGKKGGWALFDSDTKQLVEAGRLWFDDPRAIFKALDGCDEILIERAQAAPKQGISTAFEYGRGFGRAESAAIMTGADILYVAPAWWKGKLAIPADKSRAVEKAIKLFPNLPLFMSGASDDGVAEAVLIGSVLLNPRLYAELTANNIKRARPKPKRPSFRL